MESLRMYFKLLGIAIKSMMQFRADFLIGVLGVIGWNVVSLLAIGVILGRFYDLAGWTIWEIVFLYGLWMTGNSIYSLLFFHITDLEEYLVRGSFDLFLIRPLSPFMMLLTVEVNMNGIADVLFGVASLWLSMSRLHLQLNGVQWVYLVIMLISAALLELGITLALASVAFWTTKSGGLIYAVNQVNWNMTRQYPLEMFDRGFRILVTGLIPFAFLNYYPARWLLGKISPGDPWYFLSFLSPLVTLAVLSLASAIWQKGIRRYNSTGS